MGLGGLYRRLVLVQIDRTDVSQDRSQDVSEPFRLDINVVRWFHRLLV